MKSNLFIPLVILCITTHVVRSVYEILKYKKLLKPGRLSFAIIFANMALLWISWFVLCSFDPFRMEPGRIVRFSGILLVSAGIFAFITALLTIKTLESYAGDLITTGIYSKIRHPMYLGFILWCIGFPVIQGAVFSFFLAFLFMANILFWRHLEEIELEERFSSYIGYRKKTFF
jgi:protein-S-isoprenylcysteine O-methyltransferase Ste14